MRKRKNLTLTIEPDVADRAAVEAASRRLSLSAFVANLIRQALSGQADDQPARPATRSTPLPDCLRSLFWEFDFDALRWPDDRETVVAKIAEIGDWAALQWLRARLGEEALGAWIVRRGARGLDLRRLRLLAAILDLPEDLVASRARALAEDPWANRLLG